MYQNRNKILMNKFINQYINYIHQNLGLLPSILKHISFILAVIIRAPQATIKFNT